MKTFLQSPALIEETTLGILLLIVIIIYGVMTAIFAFHWKRFGYETSIFKLMTRLYYSISGILAVISMLLFFAILFTF